MASNSSSEPMEVNVKQEAVEDTDLESRILRLCQENPETGITDITIQEDMPQFDVKQRVTAINRLLSTGRIDLLKSASGKLLYKIKDGSADPVKGSDQQEKVVYQIIKEAGNKDRKKDREAIQLIDDDPEYTPVAKKAKVIRTLTSFTTRQKEEIIKFLKENPCIYVKHLSEFKNIQGKEVLWHQKANSMGTTVSMMKTWYLSMRTRLGRLRHILMKGTKEIDEFSESDQWVWKKFQFLVPHLTSMKTMRKPVTKRVALEKDPVAVDSSSEAESQVSFTNGTGILPVQQTLHTPTPDAIPRPHTLHAVHNPTHEEGALIGSAIREFMTTQQSPTQAACTTFFALYVENTLKKFPGSLRRVAEQRIQQVLHDVEDIYEQQQLQLHDQ